MGAAFELNIIYLEFWVGQLGERKMLTAKILLAYLLQTGSILGLDVDTSKIDPEQAYCLAENIYYEARNEDIRGQFAVASVTLNRASDGRFPNTICGVVKQITVARVSRKLVCAFSWYCESDKKGKEIPVRNKDGTINQHVVDQFQVASIVAITALSGAVEDNTQGATHFHNPFTSHPAWRKTLKKTMRVGNHDFYKWPAPPPEEPLQTVGEPLQIAMVDDIFQVLPESKPVDFLESPYLIAKEGQ
jgi:hypothetical protein